MLARTRTLRNRRYGIQPVSEVQFERWFQEIGAPAGESKYVVGHAWRPVVIEFSGIPRAGKSRCIKAVKEFLEHFGWRVLAPPEGASVTPQELKDQREFILFNIWAVSHALTSLIEGMYVPGKRYEAILLDRGLFDAVCWFTFLEQQLTTLSGSERRTITNFLRLSRWYDCVDILALFTCRSSVSAQREKEASVIPGGRITSDLTFLRGLMRQYRVNLECYTGRRSWVVRLDTSESADPRATAMPLVEEILLFVETQRSLGAIGA